MIGARRFWTEVAVERDPGGGWDVRLDRRPLRTPAGASLRVPTRALGEAIAAEWRAVEGALRPETVPLTRAANVAIDRIAPAPGPVVDAIAAYGDGDLLCYRAHGPAALRLRQAEGWDPPLGWAATALGAPLRVVAGVAHRPQPPASLAALRAAVAAEGPFALAALHELVVLSGSLVLALATRRGALDPEAAWALSRLDETWQAEHWGADPEAEAAAAARRADFLRAARMLEMLAEG
jgi:chaperone required for assembly of F1-ATPase